MESKVCTKCSETKDINKFTKIKERHLTHCKTCAYEHYYRPSALKRLKNSGKKPKSEHYVMTKEERRVATYKAIDKYKKKVKNLPEVKIARSLRRRLKKFMAKGTKLGTFSLMVGCTKQELVTHLESQFKPGMTWDNYGNTGWEIDHIRPLASFNVTDNMECLKINHYTNLAPIWANENRTKSSLFEGIRYAKGKPS